MEAMASTVKSSKELISEIFDKINNAKDKPKKIEVLRQYDTPGMRMILKGVCFKYKMGLIRRNLPTSLTEGVGR